MIRMKTKRKLRDNLVFNNEKGKKQIEILLIVQKVTELITSASYWSYKSVYKKERYKSEKLSSHSISSRMS